jgi:hypothetical protein
MRVTLVGGLLLVLATGGCAGRGGAYPEAASARTEKAQAARRAIAGAQPPLAVKDAAKLVSRSVWGVVPDPPRYKKDLRPGLLRGSAVAVSDRTLLASCAAVCRGGQVGLVRHRKYEIAQVSRPKGAERSGICLLTAPGAALLPAQAYRPPANVRPGEPVYALVNRTGDDFLLGAGRARRPDGRAAFRADLSLPPRARSAVLFDARGNLVGLSAGGAGTIAVAGLGPALVPRLAERDLGPAAATQVAFALDRQGGTEPPFFVLEAEPDSDEAPAARQAPGPARRPTAQDNSTPLPAGRGSQTDAGTAAWCRREGCWTWLAASPA